ncbi:MAG: Wzz/FepE/Etk N-terminal domain-containing protein, partial [Thermodesulfobacteriota bacterium]
MELQNQNQTKLSPEYVINLLIRREWLIIIPFFLAIVAGIILAVKLPRVYRASTLILVEPQRVPSNYVQTVIPVGIESRISTISQQILSRTNLEKVIEQFKLYASPGDEKIFMEDKVADMRKRIEVNVTRKQQKDAEAFEIAFKGEKPEQVMQVANALASFFIDENLKAREASAMGTSSFLEDELNSMRARLQELETALKDYRQKHLGALPEQLETNLRVLDRLQVALGEKQKSLRDAKDRFALIEKQISEMQSMIRESSGKDAAPLAIIPELPETKKLWAMKNELEALKAKYTPQHPDVLRQEKKIAALEKEIEEKQKKMAEETSASSSIKTTDPGKQSVSLKNLYQSQFVQYHEVKKDIADLEIDVARINNEIRIYENRVEETPKREQELLTLKRDYENINSTYNSLLQRKLEAEIAVNMEKKQKGEQFRILDAAKYPEKPIWPNMNYLFMMTL